MATTLPLFWHLSSASKKDRITSSVKLVTALEQFQAQFIPKNTPPESSDEEDEEEEDEDFKTDGLDALNAPDVSYSIRRLVRGLASPRESSRLGFAVALTELLSRLDTVTCSQIVSIVIFTSKIQGYMTGQEERDILFARLFGFTAIIKSGLIVRTNPLPTSTFPPSTATSFHEIVSELPALGEKKSWLRESAWWTIGLAIDALATSDVTWKEDALESTVNTLFVENKNWSPDKVAIALKLSSLYPKRDWRNAFSPAFKTPDILSTANLQTLARILKESTAEDDDSVDVPKSAAGSWKPQVHFVWDIILDQLLPGPDSVASTEGSFQEFFRIVVDESLFSSTSSLERKYWGFQIFQKALPRVTAANMPMLFTKNFMRTWINHLSKQDRYLHKVARQVVTDIQVSVEKNPTLGFALILQLTGVNGSHQFDKLTKTKTVEAILTSMDTEGIQSYIDYLLGLINEPTTEKTDVQAINSRRSWIIDQLAALIRNGAVPKADAWVQSILDWFVVNGLFSIKKKSPKSQYRALHVLPTPVFSEELQQSCRARLLNCLGDLTSQTTLVKSGDSKMMKVPAVASDGEFWVSKVLTTIEELEKDMKHVALFTEIDEDDQALCNKAQQVLVNVQKVSGPQHDAAKGVELLLMAMLLQQYCANEQEEADSDALEACIDASGRMFAKEHKKQMKEFKYTGETPPEVTPEPVDVFVDIIIGFLEKPTAYMRTVGNQVFSLISGAVEESTIDLILSQLDHIQPDELQNVDEDMEVDEDAGTEASDNDDVVLEDEDSDEEDIDMELRKKIEDALQVNGIQAATGDSDDDSDDNDEDLMDDDQMMAIDEHLAAVFRSRADEKKSGKDVDAQREATHFKNRVLDLIDLFIKKQPTSPHLVRVILPLVELIAGSTTDEQQLSDKAKGLLKTRLGKVKDVPPVGITRATSVLDELHTRARKTHSSDMLSTLSHCSLWVSKVLLHTGVKEPVLQEYRLSLEDFITRKNSALNTGFFQDFIRRYPAISWSLRDDLVTLSSKAVNVYRQCQAFQLVQYVLTQLPSSDHHEEALSFMTSLRTALFELISSACDDKVVLTSPQMKDLFKLALHAIRQTKRLAPSPTDVTTIWEPSSWDVLHSKLAASERFKSSVAILTMCRQIGQICSTVSPAKPEQSIEGVAQKRKADDASEDEKELPVTKKVKRKKGSKK